MGAKKEYVNRELRWLSFNERVLMSAESGTIPLMERLKFIGIFSSNLDEFYAVRVGSIHRALIDPEHHQLKETENPRALLKQILKEVKRLSERTDRVLEDLLRQLRQQKICLVDENGLTKNQRDFLEQYLLNHLEIICFPFFWIQNHRFPI